MALSDTQDAAAPSQGGRLLLVLTRGHNSYLALTLLCAALFLPGLAAIPPTDRDEARFMQASKQMIESGDWVQIKFQEEPRNKKPAGIYWLQAASVRAFGQELTATWPYRLPSAIAAWIAVLLVCRAGRRLFNPTAGLFAGAALATTFITVVEAHIAKTDAALLACTTLALAMLGEIYAARAKPLLPALLFWVGIGLGILIKGPLVLLVAGATIAALCIADRDVSWLKRLHSVSGIPLALIIVLPWIIAISGTAQSNFIGNAVTQDLLPKLIGGQESHGAPPGAYIAAGLLTAWPWSLLAPFVLIAAWKERNLPAVRFCLAWLIPTWIVFELVPTKLPHYTLPLLPALALLIGWALTRPALDFARWVGSRGAVIYRILWSMLAVALGIGASYANVLYGDGSSSGAALAVAATMFAGLVALVGFARAGVNAAVAGLTTAGLLFSLSLTSGIVPHLYQLAISPCIAALAAAHEAPVALAGYHEPSVVFLLGTDTILTDTAGATAHILARPGALAVIPEADLETARGVVTAQGRTMRQLEEVIGYNYSRGDWVRLAVITAAQ